MPPELPPAARLAEGEDAPPHRKLAAEGEAAGHIHT